MKIIRHRLSAHDKVLHIEAEGVLVNIEVGLVDGAGHLVTRVDVSPDGPCRADSNDLMWVRDGARFVKLREGEAPDAVHRAAIATAARDLLSLLDQVVPASTIHWSIEDTRQHLKILAAHAKTLNLTPR